MLSGNTLRPSRPDEIEVHDLEHAVADEPEQSRDRPIRDHQGREGHADDRVQREPPLAMERASTVGKPVGELMTPV